MAQVPNPILSADDLKNHTPEAFHLTDIRALIHKLLRVADEQAQRKLDAAGVLAEEIQEYARKEGYDEGFAAGRAAGEVEGLAAGEATARTAFHARAQHVVPLLTNVLHVLEAGKTGLQAEAEAELLALALAIAARIVRHEISLEERVVTAAARSAITLATQRNDVTLHVHPNDAEVIAEELPGLHNAFGDLGKVAIVPDPEIERGGVLLKTQESEIDMQINTQLEAVRRALIGDLAGTIEADENAAGLLIPPAVPDALPEAAPASMPNDPTAEENASADDVAASDAATVEPPVQGEVVALPPESHPAEGLVSESPAAPESVDAETEEPPPASDAENGAPGAEPLPPEGGQ